MRKFFIIIIALLMVALVTACNGENMVDEPNIQDDIQEAVREDLQEDIDEDVQEDIQESAESAVDEKFSITIWHKNDYNITISIVSVG